jgi:hypothetical protein
MSPSTDDSHKKINALLFALMAAEGLIGLITLFSVPSETGSAILFGYSPVRLLLAGVILSVVIGLGVLAVAALLQPFWWQHLSRQVMKVIKSPGKLFCLVAVLFSIFIAILALLMLVWMTETNELVTQRAVVERSGFVFLWIELCILQVGLLIVVNRPRSETISPFFTPLHCSILFAITVIFYDVALYIYATTSWKIWLRGQEVIFLPVIFGLMVGLHDQYFRDSPRFKPINHLLLVAFIGVSTYALYRHTAWWVNNDFTPAKAYWHLVADAFLKGRLYLENPPSTHDLTFFNGHWYVPNPPLPAIVIMPFVALLGAANINSVQFATMVGAVNSMLLYQVLTKSSGMKLIQTNRASNLLITAVVIAGTSHWWLAIKGEMWYVSQLLAVTFTCVAVLLVLYKASPLLVGASLGVALLSRPNVFTMWLFLAGIKLFIDSQAGKDTRQWKAFFLWAVQSALPVCLAVLGLLYYNFVRFGEWLNFGYVSIHSAEWLMEAVQKYGMFNIHFVPVNFQAMFFKFQHIQISGSCFYYSPTREGMSILATTPAVIYVFRRFKLNWWTVGAWLSIILSIGLLLFYHNTGSWQLGYRYLMDFILPVTLLMGLGVGKRPSWFFIVLVTFSILINAAGIYWWFTEWWCKPGRV